MSSLFIRKYKEDIETRKHRLHSLRVHPLNEDEIKRNVFEIRTMTVQLIEDGLELEHKLTRSKTQKKKRPKRLLPILEYNSRGLTNSEVDIVYVFNDLISDNEDLFHIPHIETVLAPLQLPSKRNPFFLTRTIDEISTLAFRPDENLGINTMEVLRYKRCADALLRAELQIMNKIPLTMSDLQFMWKLMKSSKDVEILIRCVYTVLINENISTFTDQCLAYLSEMPLVITPEFFLQLINSFKGTQPILVNILASTRHIYNQCQLDSYKGEPCVQFLISWLETVLQVHTSLQSDASKMVEMKDVEVKPSKLEKEVSKTIKSEVDRSPGSGDGIRLSKLKAEIDRSVRLHVDKALKERKAGKGAPDADATDGLRYELIKLQQELLKRKILNPLHYRLVNVDNAISDQRHHSDRRQRVAPGLTPFHTMPLKWEEGREGELEVCLEGETEALILRLARVSAGSSNREVVAFIRVDKLEFNHLTGVVLDDFLSFQPKQRIQHLRPVLAKVVDLLEHESKIEGQLFLEMDRCIYSKSLSMNGIWVDVTMLRDLRSASVNIHCCPHKGSSSLSHGMITLTVSDRELLILLISQRMLFKLAFTKWSSMEAVGNWLAARLNVTKLPLKLSAESKFETLQISLNRSVEIPAEVAAEWRSRSTPLLPGVEVEMSASQFEEMLLIDVNVVCTESKDVLEAQEAHDVQLLPSRSKRVDRKSSSDEITKVFRKICCPHFSIFLTWL